MKQNDGLEPFDNGGITIEKAYEELSQEAFAVFMRMMVTKPSQLKKGRNKLAILLGYSEGRCNVILRELKNKGYITLIKGPYPGTPTTLKLAKRVILSGPSNFIKLSRHLDFAGIGQIPHEHHNYYTISVDEYSKKHIDEPSQQRIITQDSDCKACNIQGINANLDQNLENDSASTYETDFQHSSTGLSSHIVQTVNHKTSKIKSDLNKSGDNTLGTTAKVRTNSSQNSDPKNHQICEKSTGDEPKTVISREELLKRGRKKVVTFAGDETHGSDTTHTKKITPLSNKLSQIRSKNKKNKTKGKGEGGKAAKKPINWEKLEQDLRGNPVVTFEPKAKDRMNMIEVLNRKPRDPERRALYRKLTSEFGRIYARYRRMLQKSAGNQPTYLLPDKERDKYAGEAAMWCVIKEVTPRQVLEYWAANIRNFADGSMRIVPLSFLSSPANIEQVVCSVMEHTDGGQRKWKPGDFDRAKRNQNVGHSFSDVSRLHKGLRHGLIEQGFDVRGCDDRYLMSIQVAAISVAKGHRMFISSAIRDMVNWAAENIYKEQR